ncbi:MAG: DoxX family protein [Cellvibrionales bacterium]|nr:DoxX family protein [Cellvibrionales bacterium]
MKLIKRCFALGEALGAAIPQWLLLLGIRLVLFRVFWLSVQTKISGVTVGGQHFAFWSLNDSVFFQFWEYPAPLDSVPMIYAATFAEFFLSLAILAGLGTRFAALGLLVLIAVIQFVQPTGWWSAHVYWLLLTLILVRQGGGRVSLDYLFWRK